MKGGSGGGWRWEGGVSAMSCGLHENPDWITVVTWEEKWLITWNKHTHTHSYYLWSRHALGVVHNFPVHSRTFVESPVLPWGKFNKYNNHNKHLTLTGHPFFSVWDETEQENKQDNRGEGELVPHTSFSGTLYSQFTLKYTILLIKNRRKIDTNALLSVSY